MPKGSIHERLVWGVKKSEMEISICQIWCWMRKNRHMGNMECYGSSSWKGIDHTVSEFVIFWKADGAFESDRSGSNRTGLSAVRSIKKANIDNKVVWISTVMLLYLLYIIEKSCKNLRWILQLFVYNRSSRNNMKSGKGLNEDGKYFTSIGFEKL